MQPDFVCVDVETSNADLASICQIGVVAFGPGEEHSRWSTLLDPEDEFSPINVGIHGICEADVAGAARLPEVFDRLCSMLADRIVVTHTHFDRVAMERAAERYGKSLMPCTWLDSARVVRRAWPEFSRSGYGLENVAAFLGIDYGAHNAEEDAWAAGMVLRQAVAVSGVPVDQWVTRVDVRPARTAPSYEANSAGPLFGETVVFTGSLSLPRREAAALAASVGCEVASGVTKSTTLLVVGDQDIRKLGGNERSAKHRKAESRIAAGFPIRILRESDFSRLVPTVSGS